MYQFHLQIHTIRLQIIFPSNNKLQKKPGFLASGYPLAHGERTEIYHLSHFDMNYIKV